MSSKNKARLLAIFLSLPLAAFSQLPDSLQRKFEYSPQAVAFTKDSSFMRGHAMVERLVYVSVDSFVTSAFLVYPYQKQRGVGGPLIVFQHWGEGDKTEFLDEAISLAQKGFVSVLPDGPALCPQTPIRSFKRQGDEMYRQCVLNARVAIDFAQQRFLGLRSAKVFFVGHSFGCNIGTILAAVEPRFDYFVFMAGTASATRSTRDSQLPDFVEWREGEPALFNTWMTKMRPFDGEWYLPYKTRPCLIQVANQDEYFTQQENEYFIRITPSPKEVRDYDTKHGLNKRATKDRKRWIKKQAR